MIHIIYCRTIHLCIGPQGYYAANPMSWCADSKAIPGVRNGCASDEACLAIGRKTCDADAECFGVGWYQPKVEQDLIMCLSNKMEPKTDGWRTMMKQGENTLTIWHFSFI